MIHHRVARGLILVVAILLACNSNQQKNKVVKAAAPPSPSAEVAQAEKEGPGDFIVQSALHFDSTEIKKFFYKYPILNSYKAELISFYKKNNYAFVWFDQNGMIEQAGKLYNRLCKFGEEGLKDSIAYKNDLDQLVESQNLADGKESEAEIMFTSQYFRFGDKTFRGLDRKTLTQIEWYLPVKKLPLGEYLDSLLRKSADSFLTNDPVYKQYSLLKSYLKKYNDFNSAEPDIHLKGNSKSFKVGDSSSDLKLIRKRLYDFGDLQNDNGSAEFDSEFENGIKNFQERLGLTIDGKLGAGTLRELITPLSKRLQQIMINMERSRWLPLGENGDYIYVNIPEFKLHVVEKGVPDWDMKVVVGKSVNKTTIFEGDVKYVVFSPYWNVPVSIIKKEIIPGMRKNKNYLKNHDMEITGYMSGGIPIVRQKPGPNNSLGLVKFLFPNSHSIYMHDSPAKSLFNESSRAFSHGCIRLAEPKKMAMYLLRNYPEWTEDKIDLAMNSGREKTVSLKNPLPVYIGYFTCWVDKHGKLNFRNDVYKRDDRLAEMLFSNGKPAATKGK